MLPTDIAPRDRLIVALDLPGLKQRPGRATRPPHQYQQALELGSGEERITALST